MTTIDFLHSAAQFLAATANSFCQEQPDYSQASLGWNASSQQMSTLPIQDRYQLSLDVGAGMLLWLDDGRSSDSLVLEHMPRDKVLEWIRNYAIRFGLGAFKYCFNYSLPIHSKAGFEFPAFDTKEGLHVAQLYSNAEVSLLTFVDKQELETEVRIWPHHFDMGFHAQIDSALSIGAGLAVPDTVEHDWYYYVTGWSNGQKVVPVDRSLRNGRWHPDWDGATLLASDIAPDTAINFLVETHKRLIEGHVVA